ncbi:MAG TPA: YSC84-related protein [Parvularculaceae bacterium]|nr:YSC84-related protein [Parvularculaceae bacterium]
MTKLAHMMLALTLAFALAASEAEAASKETIDRRVANSLTKFKEHVHGGGALLAKAAGVLVFPSVKKAGIGIGGEYGEGALLVGGHTVGYYSTAAASIGFQLGAQARTELIVFIEKSALDQFRNSDGWKIGVDASVAVVVVGAGADIDATALDKPIIAFIFNNKGLMYNLSLEGSKISKINRH